MTKYSEGVRRILLVISVLFTIGCISFVGIVSDRFCDMNKLDWLVFAIGIIISYFIPIITWKIIYWIIEGFRLDKK